MFQIYLNKLCNYHKFHSIINYSIRNISFFNNIFIFNIFISLFYLHFKFTKYILRQSDITEFVKTGIFERKKIILVNKFLHFYKDQNHSDFINEIS
jgi:hypothetical protein